MRLASVFLIFLIVPQLPAQNPAKSPAPSQARARTPARAHETAEICGACVHGDLDFLASDELHGRGSGTRDEHLAALYVASLFQSFGLEAAGENGGYIQRAPLPNPLPERLAGYLKKHGFDQNERTDTWNALGLLRGTDAGTGPAVAGEVILLTAHLDHLGLGEAVNGDSIYNGADDDASGTTAVLELARALSKGQRPRRSILFVLFGSEELGGYGNAYFLEHPPVRLTQIVANLEFEMIGNQDPKMPPGVLLLTGWERSNLGPALKEHGALVGPDPYPEQHFFERSDNYALALQGVVAHTAAGWGTPPTYHQPDDDMDHLDLAFMTRAIQSLIEPVRWLASSDFRPQWNAGGQPQR